MGLNFNKPRNIQFGKVVVDVPVLGQKDKLKLQQINLDTEAGRQKAIEAIASIFEENADYIKEFMCKNMTDFDIARAQAYIVGGDSMLESFDKQLEKEFDKAMEEVQ